MNFQAFRSVMVICGAVLALANAQTCDPAKVTAPCELGCPTGNVCDSTGENCCLQSDMLASTGTTTVSSSNTGSTVSSGSSTTRSSGGVTSSSSSSSGCVDKVNPSTGVSDCSKRASLCNDANYYDVMTQQCPKTCGRCSGSSTTSSSSSCVDLTNPKTGTSDCPGLARLCNDSNYNTLMRTQCPKTCGFCGSASTSSGGSSTTTASSRSSTISGACVDQVNPSTGTSDCARNVALCNDSNYQSLMRTQCPRTCGFCTSG